MQKKRKWYTWRVEVITDPVTPAERRRGYGGRYFDTVKARSIFEAEAKANRASGNFKGSGWYAVGAEVVES